ncbi:spermine/spermidine synthase [Ophiocordyceps camponoti-floridani]|uniref:Spermine/spermidine synthase n=1 Tax=Ophiocordyceps camponoti-floridani TaxID=2030778 RepID=A0A8H4QE65_9HYPO|nr:spermine/spermidine synthase [Ophiocordyceps camponoti-floridani]
MPAKTASKAPAPAPAPADGFTPERFEAELKDLAAKARDDSSGKRVVEQLFLFAKAALLLALLGVYSFVSPLYLSPVYGSLPASSWHSQLLMVGCFIGWAGNVAFRNLLPVRTTKLLPLVALYIPTVQWFLVGYSSLLGPRWGPLVTEGVTLMPLAVLTAASVADLFEDARLPLLPGFIAEAAPGIGSWAWLKFVELLAGRHLPPNMGRLIPLTRLGMELMLGAVYAVLDRSKILVYVLPPLMHTMVFNTHLASPASTSRLVSSMLSDNWLLLERRESLTGYVSVVQSLERRFRAMRCDHSILGGDWINERGRALSEPIYGVFVMLEAVRLAERDDPPPDKEARALVVGLGVGTTPSTLVTHGINTTVVEIDPVVYEFAVKYFDLKENNAPVLEDAVSYTSSLSATAPQSYDYIIHDVFTGGAEPVQLFTLEFLQSLEKLLKPNGVIAINYAGDLALPPPAIIMRTIKRVFPTCRVFREVPPDAKAMELDGADFANMAIFCTKSSSPLTFRSPTPADHLESETRKMFLTLEHEMLESEILSRHQDDATVLLRNDTSAVEKWHEQGALGHWAIMRRMLPASVWERW